MVVPLSVELFRIINFFVRFAWLPASHIFPVVDLTALPLWSSCVAFPLCIHDLCIPSWRCICFDFRHSAFCLCYALDFFVKALSLSCCTLTTKALTIFPDCWFPFLQWDTLFLTYFLILFQSRIDKNRGKFFFKRIALSVWLTYLPCQLVTLQSVVRFTQWRRRLKC